MTIKHAFAASLVVAALCVSPSTSSAQERVAPLLGDATSFGPVTLGADDGLRLCHANAFGDGSVRGVWLFFVLGDGSVKPAGAQRVPLDRGQGGCMDLAGFKFFTSPDDRSVSLLAVLVGFRGQGGAFRNLLASAQRFEMLEGGTYRFGDLLPAVQKPNLLLPALPAVQ